MIRTVVLLLVTLLVFPIVAFTYGQALTELQLTLLKTSGIIMVGVALFCFTLSRLTGNCSQVDKVWSLMPIVYTWYFAFASDWNSRNILMAVLVTVWGLRLSFNFARRGGYSWKFWEGEQDYRWDVLKSKPEFKNPFVWMLFDLFFISFYQNALVWLFTLPAVLVVGSTASVSWGDCLIGISMLGLIVFETIADQQQWNYQNAKLIKQKSGVAMTDEEAQGFISSGLWKYSRHPNYLAEQTIWVVFYLFSVEASGAYVNWSLAGALLLLLLFQGSANFSEEVSASKYPAYKEYQKRVPRFIPKFGATKHGH